MRRSLRCAPPAVLVALLALLARAAGGAEVSIELQSPITWSETPVILSVRIVNPERGTGRPELPAIDGVLVRGPGGPSQQTSVVNGQVSSLLEYHFELTPLPNRKGRFTVGPVTVPRQGRPPLKSRTVELRVCLKPPPGILFEASVSPAGGPVGAPFQLVYTILYTGELNDGSGDPFSGAPPFGIGHLGIPVLQHPGLKLKPVRVRLDQDAVEGRLPVGHDEVHLQLQRGFAERPDGTGYKTLVFGFEVTPLVTGPVAVGGAEVKLQVLTGKTVLRRDLLFARRVPEVVAYSAIASDLAYEVRPLPEEGRPPGFTGAVGKYSIQVAASPTEVKTFDPITLEIRVSGTGILEELKAPAWSEVPSLTRDFDVATDTDPGKVEGAVKVFVHVVRPRHERVAAVPPIPFPYFDPEAQRYQVAQSSPIPIKVQAVKTVGAEDAIPSARSALPDPARAAKDRPAPAIQELAGVGANFDDLGDARPALDPRDEVFSAGFAAAVALPPALLAVLAAALRILRADSAKRRRARALSRASAAIAAARGFGDIARACEDYCREKLGLPPGEVTPADLAAALEARGVPEAARSRALGLLERVHASRFGGGGEPLAAFGAEAREALEEVDACVRG
ncbi:MAG: BatD family protein [Planctomycetes bacterium]|nr:BatD family protein [Planctomycetota bacterium]